MTSRDRSLLRTPAHSAHERLGARFSEFAGWLLPLRYPAGTLEEHLRTRNTAGVFDVSHLGRLLVEGPGAFTLLQMAFTNDLSRISPGKAQYTLLLNESGGIVDDIVVLWETPDRFVVVPNAANTEAVATALVGLRDDLGLDIAIDNVTMDTAMIAVQGPASEAVCLRSELGMCSFPKRFDVERVGEYLVAGTGYTGERGIEIIVPAARGSEVFENLVRCAEGEGGGPAGLAARDTLRLEMGYPLWGNEMDRTIAPPEAGLDWVVADSKEDFLGKRAALERRRQPRWRPIGLVMEEKGAIPRAGYRVIAETTEGTVTSGGFSPVLSRGIALARMPASYDARDVVPGTRAVALAESLPQILTSAPEGSSEGSLTSDALGAASRSPQTSGALEDRPAAPDESSTLLRVSVEIRGRTATGIVARPPFVTTSLG